MTNLTNQEKNALAQAQIKCFVKKLAGAKQGFIVANTFRNDRTHFALVTPRENVAHLMTTLTKMSIESEYDPNVAGNALFYISMEDHTKLGQSINGARMEIGLSGPAKP